MFSKFALKLLETTAIHLVAGAAAKTVEKGIVLAADKIKTRQSKPKAEPSTKTDEDFEGLK